MMTDLLMNKNDTLIIISILYVSYRWRMYYLNSNPSNNLNGILQNKDINFDETFIKLKITKNELEGKKCT